jgi:hypothetical protein
MERIARQAYPAHALIWSPLIAQVQLAWQMQAIEGEGPGLRLSHAAWPSMTSSSPTQVLMQQREPYPDICGHNNGR